ncbi:MAG: GAF domain-containing protein [Fimbriimonadaceae bacterium]|nr:GAF domain-containing protein [Fimbriimonadaceae bacterium]
MDATAGLPVTWSSPYSAPGWQVARALVLLAALLIVALAAPEPAVNGLLGVGLGYVTLSLLAGLTAHSTDQARRLRLVGDIVLATCLILLHGPGINSPLRYLLVLPVLDAGLLLREDTVLLVALACLVAATFLTVQTPGRAAPYELIGLAATIVAGGLVVGTLARDAAERQERDRRMARLLHHERATSTIAGALRRPLPLTALADLVLDTAQALPAVQSVTLALLNAAGDTLEPWGSRSRGGRPPARLPQAVEPDELGGAAGPPAVITTRSLDLDGTNLVVPLVGEEHRLIGRLTLLSSLPDLAIDRTEREALGEFGQQAGLAWETAWLRNSLHEQARDLSRSTGELTALFEVSRALVTVDSRDVLNEILGQAMALMAAERGSLMLLDEERTELRIETARGLSEEVVAATRVRLGEGIAGLVALSGEPLRLVDAADLEEARSGVRDALCVPLRVHGRVIGVLNIANKTGPGVFGDRDLDLLSALANHAAVAILNTRLFGDLQDLFLSTVGTLAKAVDAKDRYTAGHSHRVTLLALETARELRLAPADLDLLRVAALMHDVGKIGIPEAILCKPGPLTAEERAVMQQHPLHGARIIAPVKRLHAVLPGIRWHHERYDGQGYPDRKAGDEIPTQATVLAVADAYDAMTSDRPYRRGLADQEALRRLREGAGSQWHPAAVDAFLAAYDAGRIAPIRGLMPADDPAQPPGSAPVQEASRPGA